MKTFKTKEKAPFKIQMMLSSTANRGTIAEFFVGWIKRFGTTMKLFAFPLNKKEHPNL
ncbi:MAG: hypothetical protein NWE98_01835 [Candidatus Bathyarchaeota archaeon]|nr:hypothetical protein [Candidatus Bathyarchaeota archaeon]